MHCYVIRFLCTLFIAVDPVVEGKTRSEQFYRGDTQGKKVNTCITVILLNVGLHSCYIVKQAEFSKAPEMIIIIGQLPPGFAPLIFNVWRLSEDAHNSFFFFLSFNPFPFIPSLAAVNGWITKLQHDLLIFIGAKTAFSVKSNPLERLTIPTGGRQATWFCTSTANELNQEIPRLGQIQLVVREELVLGNANILAPFFFS